MNISDASGTHTAPRSVYRPGELICVREFGTENDGEGSRAYAGVTRQMRAVIIPSAMINDEARMTKQIPMTKPEVL